MKPVVLCPLIAGRSETGSALCSCSRPLRGREWSVFTPSLRLVRQPVILIAWETLQSRGIPGLRAASYIKRALPWHSRPQSGQLHKKSPAVAFPASERPATKKEPCRGIPGLRAAGYKKGAQFWRRPFDARASRMAFPRKTAGASGECSEIWGESRRGNKDWCSSSLEATTAVTVCDAIDNRCRRYPQMYRERFFVQSEVTATSAQAGLTPFAMSSGRPS